MSWQITKIDVQILLEGQLKCFSISCMRVYSCGEIKVRDSVRKQS